ncbi:MAG TPA: TIR domain-containing protein, partial [Ktedonobacterales bacterium]|nr:TIR domain-containing protein [Ktedonobacterales bacterium]
PGTDWQASIDQGLATCHAVVVLASRSAHRSTPVQYEITAARKAGKPIYLAVIEDCPLVAELRDVATVIDCRSRFSASVKTLAQSIQSSLRPQTILRRTNPFGLRMPFGQAKYLQLIWLNLCFLLGTGAILLRKQISIHFPLNPRILPFLVLATIPVVLWLLSFAYSFLLLVAFRRQRRATYLELELWPVISIFAWPALLNVLFSLATQEPNNSLNTGFGPDFNAHLAIIDRAAGDPTLPWQLLLEFSAYGVYILFLTFTLRGWPLACGWILMASVLIVPPLLRIPALLIIGGSIALLSMRGFLSGRDVPIAFGEREAKYDVISRKEIPWEQRAWGMWLSPGAFPNEAFVGENLRLHSQPPATAAAARTWQLHSVPADAVAAQGIRRAFAGYPALREIAGDQADYQIAVLSNKTPRHWIDALAARYPRLICVNISSLDINLLATVIQRNQW